MEGGRGGTVVAGGEEVIPGFEHVVAGFEQVGAEGPAGWEGVVGCGC